MISRLKALVYLGYTTAKSHLAELRRWRQVRPLSEGVLVYYGHDSLPKPGEKAAGGIVKCQDLAKVFPNTPWQANVLYLVSSALPPCPKLMVRYARKKGVKVVVNQNGVAIPAYHGRNLEVINAPRRFLIQQADHVIYQSEYCKVSADKFLGGRDSSFAILHNPVDTVFFGMRPNSRPAAIPKLLMTGSHGRFYRVSSAIDIVATLAGKGIDVELLLAGRLAWHDDSSVCEAELFAYSEKKGVRQKLKLLGKYSQLEAPRIYQQADIFLHTQYNDACPRVIVEAMSSGLPVVYSASGGVPELVGQEAGIGIEVPSDWDNIHEPDPQRAAMAICRIIGSYPTFSHNARERAVDRFDLQPWLARHQRLFEDLYRM